MKHIPWLGTILAGIALMYTSDVAHAQIRFHKPHPDRDYVRFPTDADLPQILSKELHRQKVEELRHILARLQRNPEQLKLLTRQLNSVDLKDPKLRPHIEDWINKNKDEWKLTPEQVKVIKQALKKNEPPPSTNKDSDKGPPGHDAEPDENGKSPPGSRQPGRPPAPAAENAGEDGGMPAWATNLIKDVSNLKFGERLSESPAWRRSLMELEGFFTERGSDSLRLNREPFERVVARFTPDGGEFGLTKKIRERLLQLSPPSMPGLNVNVPDPANMVPRVTGMLGGPTGRADPSEKSGLFAGEVLLWIFLAVLLALLLWNLLGRSVWRERRSTSAGWQLGPWPLHPAQVATRAQLIQAFDYLAVLLLGPGVRTWNHRQIATALVPDAGARRQAAEELAWLYEQARYAPGDGPLSALELAAARRDLCLLAGVAQA